MRRGEPCRRRVCGRADDHRDVVLFREPDRAHEPVQIVTAFCGLDGAPCKLADAHHVQMSVLHQLQVGIPARLGPLLGVPRRAQQQRRRSIISALRNGRTWARSKAPQLAAWP